VLDAPEQNRASEPARPRRVSATPNRKLRRDFSEDFADDFDDEDDAPVGRRRRGNSGFRLRFRGLPTTKGGRIFAGIALVLLLGLCAAVVAMARNMLLRDERFVIPSSSSIELLGNEHVTRAQMLSVFGEDVERNIFSVPLAQRRAELERLPWVAHATVMRLLPNRLRVSVVERVPVAFVRQGSHIGLVDAGGVLLDMPPAVKADAHYSFPVVTGISAQDPLSTRAARMKIFERFTSDLDGGGEKISDGLSEVDLSNPEDVKALIPDHSTEILVHFGDTDFLDRYHRFEEHLPEWKTVYPKLSSVDMRYERQVVLEMQQGSAVPVAAAGQTADAGDTQQAEPKKAAPVVRPAVKPAAKAGTKTHAAVIRPPAVVKTKPAIKTRAHVTAQSEVAFPATAKPAGAKSKAGKAKEKPHKPAPAKHHPVVVRPSAGTPQYHPPQVVHP
jgi:cell division protein FtsQ